MVHHIAEFPWFLHRRVPCKRVYIVEIILLQTGSDVWAACCIAPIFCGGIALPPSKIVLGADAPPPPRSAAYAVL